MEGLDALSIGTLLIRAVNAVLWTIVILKIIELDRPVPRLVRQLLASVIFFGMWALALGALTQFGLLSDAIRPLYTAFTAYAGLIALAIVTTDVLDDGG